MPRLDLISKSYEEKTLFRDFSYLFPQKGVFALCGKSGTGKTTLLRIMSGLDKDFSGNCEGFGISNTSFCFQEYRLFPTLTALENIARISFKSSAKENEAIAKNMLKRLDFSEEDIMLFPDELSGGMKQRVAFARAILRDAPVLLLDECTKELDKEVAHKMLSIIKEEAEKRLVILVTHKEDELSYLDAVKIEIDQ